MTLFLKRHDKNKHLFTPIREPTTDQSMDTTKIQLDEQIKYYWDYGNRSEGLLKGTYMTQRQLYHHSLPPPTAQETSHES